MRFFADLHVHSRFSMATSPSHGLADLSRWAAIKGVGLLATGDATHPGWLSELEDGLEEAEEGLFFLRKELRPSDLPSSLETEVRFALQSEVSAIYKDKGKTRRVHLLFYFPSFRSARRFSAALSTHANIHSDGRPVTSLHARGLFELFLEKAPGGYMIPAHVMTPWYSLLGAKSGYDSPAECFGDLTPLIPAMETGLSADPAMLRRIPSLDGFGLVSSSDAHSPKMIGREASEFDLTPSFSAVFEAMRPGDPRFLSTLEYFPELGKYHVSGHRKCNAAADNDVLVCPVCAKPFTEGVLSRVKALSGRETGCPERPSVKLTGLCDILSAVTGRGQATKTVRNLYSDLVSRLGPELSILRDSPAADLETAGGPLFSRTILAIREGTFQITPGYDGSYGSFTLPGKAR